MNAASVIRPFAPHEAVPEPRRAGVKGRIRHIQRDTARGVAYCVQTVSEPDVITLSAENSPERGNDRRCPALIAFAIAWARPATIGGRTSHISLRSAFLLHLLAAVFSTLLITFVVVAFSRQAPLDVDFIFMDWLTGLYDVIGEWRRRPFELSLATAGVAVLVEIGFLALGLLLIPWGAKNEPIRASYAHALRQVWLHTTHLILIVVLFAAFGIPLDRKAWDWELIHDEPQGPMMPTSPNLAVGDPGYTEAQSKYQAEMKIYTEQFQKFIPVWIEWQRNRPWYVKYQEPAFFQIGFVLACWFLWSLMRGVGAPRRVERIERPPMCEFCGYNLTAMSMESRCPECGESVTASLGADVRPGPAWNRRRELGRLRAWSKCLIRAAREPTWLGRQIRLNDDDSGHRSFLWLHLPVLFVLGAAGMLLGVVATGGGDVLLVAPELFFLVVPMFGYMATFCGLGVTLFTALVVGAYYSRLEQRNLLPGSMQVASFMAGYVILSAFFAFLFGTAIIALGINGWFEYLEELTGLHDRYIGVMCWLLPMIALGIGYFWLVARGTAALRYANK